MDDIRLFVFDETINHIDTICINNFFGYSFRNVSGNAINISFDLLRYITNNIKNWENVPGCHFECIIKNDYDFIFGITLCFDEYDRMYAFDQNNDLEYEILMKLIECVRKNEKRVI